MRMRLMIPMLACVALMGRVAESPGRMQDAPPEAATPVAAPETVTRLAIPLQDGELHLGVLIGRLAAEIGLDGEAIAAACDESIPVRSALGSSTIRLINSLTSDIITLSVGADEVAVTVDRVRWRQEKAVFHKGIQRLIEYFAPDAAALARASFGVVVHRADAPSAALSPENAPRHAVVLIHGLDDAGRLWWVLIPALHQEGYTALEVTYPDDQAIAESSAFVAGLFEQMRSAGVERVSIVAHSMGALISRDLLTGDSYYAGRLDGGERFPSVERLIMLGPPNHGSRMALFRLGSEARDQVTRALSGDGLLVGGFFDGAGEAQDDLVPGSDFLTNLDARPLPPNLPVTIIAGSASPFDSDDIASLVTRIDNLLVTKYGKAFDGSQVEKTMSDLVDGVGDGCVSIESTRLEGVTDHVVVEANHLGMIRPFGSVEPATLPPAIPIILERLGRDRGADP